MNIYIGNLADSALESDLRGAFESHGRVRSVSIIKDARTGEPRGFGYVDMPDLREALTAIRAVHRREFGGRVLAVGPARLQARLTAWPLESQADYSDFAR
jgi:RNA recognition motif-containing protein